MASVKDENCLSPYRKLLADLSFDLSSKEVETLNLLGVDFIPRGTTEKIYSGLQFFDVLEQDGRIGPRNLNLLQDMFETIGRVDLARKIQAFLTTSVNDKTCGMWRKWFSIFINVSLCMDYGCFGNMWCAMFTVLH